MDHRLGISERTLRLQPRRGLQALSKLLTQWIEDRPLPTPPHLFSALLCPHSLNCALLSYPTAESSKDHRIATFKTRLSLQPRRKPQSQLEEEGAGYTFFWSGCPRADQQDAGIALVIRNDIVGRLPCLPQDINDRLLLRLFGEANSPSSLASTLPSPMTISDVARNKFYEDMHALLATLSKPDKTPYHPDQHLPPPSDAREGNVDAPLVAPLASAEIFPHPEARPAGRAGDEGDPVFRRVDRPSTRHLQDEDLPTAMQETSRSQLAQRLAKFPVATDGDENATAENRWGQPRDTIQSTDWFDNNGAAISNLLAKKNRLQKACANRPTDDNKAAFDRSRRVLQQRLQEIQDARTARKTEEIQGVPKRPSAISDAAIARLPQVETSAGLDLPPSLHETIKVVQQIPSGKAPGSEAIPAEIYKNGGSQNFERLTTTLFMKLCLQGEVPQDFKDAAIVHIYKRKGNCQIRDNHRGISLHDISGKIFVRILLNNCLGQGLQPKSQCGFRRHHGTTDMIFAACQPQEKC
ncbi:hypothetical protein SprV_0602206400 [Sparganum proliferum]